MTDDEQQLLKVGAGAVLQPFTDLVKQLFGASVDEAGRIFGEEVRASLRYSESFCTTTAPESH